MYDDTSHAAVLPCPPPIRFSVSCGLEQEYNVMGEITLVHLVTFGGFVIAFLTTITGLLGWLWKYSQGVSRRQHKLEETIKDTKENTSDISELKELAYGTQGALKEHIAVADERDKTAKDEIDRLRDRVNGHK